MSKYFKQDELVNVLIGDEYYRAKIVGKAEIVGATFYIVEWLEPPRNTTWSHQLVGEHCIFGIRVPKFEKIPQSSYTVIFSFSAFKRALENNSLNLERCYGYFATDTDVSNIQVNTIDDLRNAPSWATQIVYYND